MHHYKYLVFLPLALAAAGLAKAGNFCNDGQFFESTGDWHGNRCDLVQRTRPIEELALPVDSGGGGGKSARHGGLVEGASDLINALPDYSDLDLNPYYSSGQKDEIRFSFDMADLDMVDPGEGAEVSVFQLGLRSLRPFDKGRDDYCELTMALGDGSALGSGRTLRFYWTCRYETPDLIGGDTVTSIEGLLTLAQMDPASTRLEVSLKPARLDWTRIAVSARLPGSTLNASLPFDQGQVLDVPGPTQGFGYQPVFLRAGIIDGSLQRPGMTMRYQFFSPEIVEAPVVAEPSGR